MLRKLFAPQWLAFGLVALAALGTCLRLGWWQWMRFVAGDGDFQNLGYTALWPVFGVFAIYLWWRLLADAVRTEREEGSGSGSTPGGTAGKRRGWTRTPEVELSYDPAARVAERVADDEEDPELAAYNQYLASLNAKPEARR